MGKINKKQSDLKLPLPKISWRFIDTSLQENIIEKFTYRGHSIPHALIFVFPHTNSIAKLLRTNYGLRI